MAEEINDKCGLTVKIHYKYHIIEKKYVQYELYSTFFFSE